MTTEKLPLNRDEFCIRYNCSKTTFWRWVKKYEIEKQIPEINTIRLFNLNQSKIIISILG